MNPPIRVVAVERFSNRPRAVLEMQDRNGLTPVLFTVEIGGLFAMSDKTDRIVTVVNIGPEEKPPYLDIRDRNGIYRLCPGDKVHYLNGVLTLIEEQQADPCHVVIHAG